MKTLLFIVIAYLLGSIPSGVWVGKLLYKKDIRNYGSGNSGATNAFRVFGKKAGTIVILLDFIKGIVATTLPIMFDVDVHPLIIGLFSGIGHAYPIFANFVGGKAAATTGGIIFAVYPGYFLFAFTIFALSVYVTSVVSFSSMLFGVVLVIISFFAHDIIFTLITLFMAAFLIYRHQENIERLKKGEEREVSFGLHLLQKNNNKN